MVLLIPPTRRGRFRRYVPLRWLHRVRPRDSDVHRGEEECARGYHDRADGGYHRCLFDPRGHSRLVAQTSECTFSAISKPILATEGLFCSSSWDLQGLHTFCFCTAPNVTFAVFRTISQAFSDISGFFQSFADTLFFVEIAATLQQFQQTFKKTRETFCKFNGKKVGWLVA